MKHAYVPRTTNYTLTPGDELNDLRMSEQVRPLYDHVKKFIRETVEPMSVEFYRHGEKKADCWSFTDRKRSWNALANSLSCCSAVMMAAITASTRSSLMPPWLQATAIRSPRSEPVSTGSSCEVPFDRERASTTSSAFVSHRR